MSRFYLYRSHENCAIFTEVKSCVRRYDLGEVLLSSDIAEVPSARPGCVVARLSSDVSASHDLLAGIREYGLPLSVIFVADNAVPADDVAILMRCGAIDVLQQPFNRLRLRDSLCLATTTAERAYEQSLAAKAVRHKFELLSFGEREVLQTILAGVTNKRAAVMLGIAMRTVEARRRRIFHSLGTRSVAEMVAMLITARPDLAAQSVKLSSLQAAVQGFSRAVRKRAKRAVGTYQTLGCGKSGVSKGAARVPDLNADRLIG